MNDRVITFCKLIVGRHFCCVVVGICEIQLKRKREETGKFQVKSLLLCGGGFGVREERPMDDVIETVFGGGGGDGVAFTVTSSWSGFSHFPIPKRICRRFLFCLLFLSTSRVTHLATKIEMIHTCVVCVCVYVNRQT